MLSGCLYESSPWVENEQERQDRRQGRARRRTGLHPTPLILSGFTVYLLLSQSPIQSFFHITNHSITYIYTTNNSSPLQVMHGESIRVSNSMFSGSFFFKGISTNSCLNTKSCPWSRTPGSLSHTTDHSTLQSWRDWEAGLLGQHLGCCHCGLPLSQWASTRESNSGHCLWLLCCVGWAGVLWKECWAWSWSLLRCEHFLLSPCVRRDALTAKSQQQQWHNRLGRGNHKEWSSDVVCAHLDVGGLQDKGCLLFTFKWL